MAPELSAPAAITFTDTAFNDSFAEAIGTLAATDADSGDTLTYGLSGGTDIGGGQFSLTGAYGTLTLDSATGGYTFIADDAALEALTGASSDTFTVTVSDGTDSDSDTLSVNIVQNGTTESTAADTLSGTAGVDSFAGQKFSGRVDSIAPASGAQFALLPPDNATGNFTKIVQRIPVKIVFDEESAREFAGRISPGMSAVVKVRVRG